MSVEDWAEIRRLHRAERMPVKVIARVLGCSKNTVKKALRDEAQPAYRPDFGGPLPGAALNLRCEIGWRRCVRTGRACVWTIEGST